MYRHVTTGHHAVSGMLEYLTFYSGLGVLIVAFAAYALPGALTYRRRGRVERDVAVAGAGAAAGAEAEARHRDRRHRDRVGAREAEPVGARTGEPVAARDGEAAAPARAGAPVAPGHGTGAVQATATRRLPGGAEAWPACSRAGSLAARPLAGQQHRHDARQHGDDAREDQAGRA